MYEIVCNTNSVREAWIREIRAASEKCPAEEESQPQEDDEAERRLMEARSAKMREIIGRQRLTSENEWEGSVLERVLWSKLERKAVYLLLFLD